ncbi:MAG: InlB B-repeat-containing protein, partial [Bacilli bacterium]|nr:InlB B-repeat-containing protein [Bacilli bacterium]
YYQNGKDEHIKAVFVEIITNLTVSCDGFENGNFYYNLDRKEMPNLANLVVKNEKGRTLNASEFIVDASKVDYEKTGTYEITITYKYDKDVKTILTVEVPKAETYSYIESEDVEKGVIKMNGEIIVKDPDGYREEVELGGTLTLTAEPKEGYKFAGWYITNSLNGEKRLYSTNETETFTITDNTYIFAKFIEKDMVTLTVIAGEGGYVFEYNETGTSQNMKRLELAVKEGEKVKVSASGEYVYSKFVGWYDGEGENATLISTESLHEFIVTANATVYARFEKAFYVNARIENGGEFVDSPYVSEDGFYRDDLPENSEVTIEVKAKEGYYFVGWFISADYYSAEGLLSTELKHTFIVNEETNNLNLTALFRAIATEIKLEDSSDYGFYLDNDGKLVTEYLLNLNQEFYAMPDGQPLLGKIGDKYERLILGLEYKVESTINYTKNGMFDTSKEGTYTITYTYLNNPELKVVMNFKVVELVRFLAQCMPHNSGYLLEDGQRVDFANGKLVEKGTKITLTAVANSEYNFVGWFYFDSDQSEKLISTDATYTFTVNEERYVYAKFVEKEMHLFNAYPTEAGYITENGQEVDFGNVRRVEKGTQITLTAHVKVEGYRFVGWYTSTDQNETLISTDETYTFIVNEDMFVFSKFEIIEA